MIRRKARGQLLIIALIVLALLVSTIPILLTLATQIGKRFSSRSSKERISDVARGAFAYVSYTFESHPDAWTRALKGDPLKDLGFDGSQNFQGVQSTAYTIECHRDATLPPGQIKVDVNVIYGKQTTQKSNLFQSVMSYPTMGVDLPNKKHVPAALYVAGDIDLDSAGGIPPELEVHWGSIVCFGSIHLAREPDDSLYGHHPRKFCRADFQAHRSMDDPGNHADYWTEFPMGNPMIVDEEKYEEFSDTESYQAAASGVSDSSATDTGIPNQLLVFRGSEVFDEKNPHVYFVNSPVRFESEGIDFSYGGMIIAKDATFDGQKDGLPLLLRVPDRAEDEYPFLPAGVSFPCEDKIGASCTSAEANPDHPLIDFRGFLYVKGDLYINQDTVIAGLVRVDGKLHIAPGKRLTIYFDDQISQAIPLQGAILEQRIVSQPL